MQRIIVQTEAATETTPGAIAEGHYNLIDGKVVVTDLQGRPIGTEEAKPGDDPTVIAKRNLAKGETGQGRFLRASALPATKPRLVLDRSRSAASPGDGREAKKPKTTR